MNTKSIDSSIPVMETSGALAEQGFPAQARLVIHMLRQMQHGALHVRFPDGQSSLFGDGSPPVSLTFNTWHPCEAALHSGDIGFAESFIDGHWTSDDLAGLLTLLVRNRAAIEPAIYGTWWGNLLFRLKHALNRNSRKGSRKNIHTHYDIGNDFYQLWLDPSMTYSSALFAEGRADSLYDAQLAKYRRILDQIHAAPHDQLAAGGAVLRKWPCKKRAPESPA
jgi:cyclopropane-fatty-acyl-phospholipid synthase